MSGVHPPAGSGAKLYILLGLSGFYESAVPGRWGGHKNSKIYGRLDCPAALRAILRGGYVKNRVFFLDEATAITAGYCPCGTCCPEKYRLWKSRKSHLAG